MAGPVTAELAFTRAEEVTREAGVARARTLPPAAMQAPGAFARRPCEITDLAQGALRPELWTHGFDVAELAGRARLHAVLERVRQVERLGDDDAAAIRADLRLASLPLASGGRLRLLHVAREGLFLRRALPGGHPRALAPGEHDAAVSVHIDQDIDGTPLRQLLRGLAPRLFRHDAPLHRNRGRLALINLWIPLGQVTRPLALMDGRSLDRRAHQLRYALPLEGILDGRQDGMRVNDIWTGLHAAGQRWYFDSTIDAPRAFVFDTLSTPHGSFVLPGEARAAALRDAVLAAVEALTRASHDAARAALARPIDPAIAALAPATAPLAAAIAALEALLAEGRALLAAPPAADVDAWAARASAAAERLVRRSLEMRAVALLSRPRP